MSSTSHITFSVLQTTSSTLQPTPTPQLPSTQPTPTPHPGPESSQYQLPKRVHRVERSYSRQKKLEVIAYLESHRVYDPQPTPMLANGQVREEWRPPTSKEASEFFRIPAATIRTWWNCREHILQGKKRVSKKSSRS